MIFSDMLKVDLFFCERFFNLLVIQNLVELMSAVFTEFKDERLFYKYSLRFALKPCQVFSKIELFWVFFYDVRILEIENRHFYSWLQPPYAMLSPKFL